MLINKIIKIKTSNKNISFYKKYFPDIKSGDIVNINTDKLPRGSKFMVDVKCDVCGNIKQMMYKTYLNISNGERYYCNKCKGEKIKNTCQEKYNVDNVFQLNEIKEKAKETCLIKYGEDYYQKTLEFRDKYRESTLKKYGVDHHMKYKDFKDKMVNSNKDNREESMIKMIKTKTIKYSKLFFTLANEIHQHKYDYSCSDYINMNTPIDIICPIHGIFSQKPSGHIYNSNGCPICNESKGERIIKNLFETNNISYEQQKTFEDCKNIKVLPFDFYLPEYNICIEYDGEQHFRAYKIFGGEDKLEKRIFLDKIKTKYCETNDIKLIRIKYDENIEEKLKYLWD